MKLNITSSATKKCVGVPQNSVSCLFRQAGQGKAGKNVICSLNPVFFQVKIHVFGAVADYFHSGVAYFSFQFLGKFRFYFKAKKKAIRRQGFQYFFCDASGSGAEFDDAFRLRKIDVFRDFSGQKWRAGRDRPDAAGIFPEKMDYFFVFDFIHRRLCQFAAICDIIQPIIAWKNKNIN